MTHQPYLDPSLEVHKRREAIAKNGHTPAYMRTDFQQSLNWGRPLELLTQDTKRSGTLEYRYTDTGETVTVPNVWYTQPASVRAETARYQAEQAERSARHREEEGDRYGAEQCWKHHRDALERARRFEEDAAAGRPPYDVVPFRKEER